MSRRWHNDLSPRIIATGLVISADHGNTGKLALGAGHGCQRYTTHAGDVFENFLQVMHARQMTLTGRLWRQRVTTQETRQTGGLMRPSRVVLHGARTQGLEPGVESIILTGKFCVMPHGLQL